MKMWKDKKKSGQVPCPSTIFKVSNNETVTCKGQYSWNVFFYIYEEYVSIVNILMEFITTMIVVKIMFSILEMINVAMKKYWKISDT